MIGLGVLTFWSMGHLLGLGRGHCVDELNDDDHDD